MALTKIGTDGVKDDAITSGKIPANAVGSSELADNAVDTAAIQDDAVTGDKIAAGTITNSNIQNGTIGTSKIGIGNITTDKIAAGNVTTAKIADQAVTLAKLEHGTSSNDGKFLRANNGADPTFETVSGTTINNNAAQRVVTGDSSANTLNGQSNLTFDGNDLTVTGIAPCVNLTDTDSDDYKISNTQGVLAIRDTTAGADRFVINDNGTGYFQSNFLVGGTTTSPGATFHVKNSYASVKVDSDGASNDTNLFFKTNGGKENKINFGDASNDYSGQITFDHNGDHMKFRIGGTNKIIINSNGLCIGGSSSDNALDDFEEGTWTPTNGNMTTFNVTSSQINARYTKVGDMVTVWINQEGGEIAWSQAQYLQGLPFSVDIPSAGSFTNNYPNSGGEALVWSGGKVYMAQTDGYNTSSYRMVFCATYRTTA